MGHGDKLVHSVRAWVDCVRGQQSDEEQTGPTFGSVNFFFGVIWMPPVEGHGKDFFGSLCESMTLFTEFFNRQLLWLVVIRICVTPCFSGPRSVD